MRNNGALNQTWNPNFRVKPIIIELLRSMCIESAYRSVNSDELHCTGTPGRRCLQNSDVYQLAEVEIPKFLPEFPASQSTRMAGGAKVIK